VRPAKNNIHKDKKLHIWTDLCLRGIANNKKKEKETLREGFFISEE